MRHYSYGNLSCAVRLKQRLNISVKNDSVFSDIQGFTELSETLIPDDLAFLLNDYLSHMTEIAKQYEATVDKFMGMPFSYFW